MASSSRRLPTLVGPCCVLLLVLAGAARARAQQFDGPRLRWPEHAQEQAAAPWVNEPVREQVEATEAVKQGLARHHLFLIPNPPHPPVYAADGSQHGGLTPEKVGRWIDGLRVHVFTHTLASSLTGSTRTLFLLDRSHTQDFNYQPGDADGKEMSWCSPAGQRVKWTSERGSVMLDGRPVFLKGINWCVRCRRRCGLVVVLLVRVLMLLGGAVCRFFGTTRHETMPFPKNKTPQVRDGDGAVCAAGPLALQAGAVHAVPRHAPVRTCMHVCVSTLLMIDYSFTPLFPCIPCPRACFLHASSTDELLFARSLGRLPPTYSSILLDSDPPTDAHTTQHTQVQRHPPPLLPGVGGARDGRATAQRVCRPR